MLSIVQDNSVDDFLSEAETLLYKTEAENSLMLGLCESFKMDGQGGKKINLFRVLFDDQTIGVAVQTPPYNLILTSLKHNEVKQLAHYLFDKKFELPGVVGPAEDTTEFSKIWSQMSGNRHELGMEQGIYKAEKVIHPTTAGFFRSAHSDEIDIVTDWLFQFSQESLPQREKFNLSFAKTWASKAISENTAFVWVVDSKPVSVAHTGRPTKNGISVRAVYTPKSCRKNGFGSAVVASLTEKMIQDGFKFCTLYTDLGNFTSNKIYQDVGYYEVLKSKHFIFIS